MCFSQSEVQQIDTLCNMHKAWRCRFMCSRNRLSPRSDENVNLGEPIFHRSIIRG
jgi:hypothetical protein